MVYTEKMLKNSRGVVEIVILVIVLIATVALATYFYLDSENKDVKEEVITKVQEVIQVTSPTPTPFPFQDMTIPYLQNREYESELGELEKVSENASYTKYLASFDSDGLQVNGTLTIPKGDQPQGGWPAVVFLHGYIPPQDYETLVNYASYVDPLAKEGLVVFKIDLRGHADSEGVAFGAYFSGDYIVDVLNAHAALQNTEFVNPGRIGLWGHSMAGNVVFRSLIASDEIDKAVIWAGAVYSYEDFDEFSISDSSYQPPTQESERRKRRVELAETWGAFDSESEFWVQVPATNYLEGVEGDLRIHHAVNDNVVSIDYSRNLDRILDDTQINHQVYQYTSGGHNLTGTSFSQAMQRSADFLNTP